MVPINHFQSGKRKKKSKQQVNFYSDKRQKAIVKETNSEKTSSKRQAQKIFSNQFNLEVISKAQKRPSDGRKSDNRIRL